MVYYRQRGRAIYLLDCLKYVWLVDICLISPANCYCLPNHQLFISSKRPLTHNCTFSLAGESVDLTRASSSSLKKVSYFSMSWGIFFFFHQKPSLLFAFFLINILVISILYFQ